MSIISNSIKTGFNSGVNQLKNAKNNVIGGFKLLASVCSLEGNRPTGRLSSSNNGLATSMREPNQNTNINLQSMQTQPLLNNAESQKIIDEVFDFYDKNQLFRKNPTVSGLSVSKVMNDATHSKKRLFLHKLRNQMTLSPNSLGQVNPQLANLPPNKVNQGMNLPSNPLQPPPIYSESFQVQTLYTHSKLGRDEGHYKPIHHDMLSNFGWIYAGIKNQQVDQSGDKKAVNLMINDEATNQSANAKIDANMLFRGGDSNKGLSALGYELAFLNAAGFTVEGRKMDPSTGLAKVKLTPPKGNIPSFQDIMNNCARGFCLSDYQETSNRKLDVQVLKNLIDNDPEWSSLIQVDWAKHGIL